LFGLLLPFSFLCSETSNSFSVDLVGVVLIKQSLLDASLGIDAALK
jgi:hypothetical protein